MAPNDEVEMSTEQTMNRLAPDARFPWSFGEGDKCNSILDADGDPVAVFPGLDSELRRQRMAAVICAVNTLAGYRAEITT